VHDDLKLALEYLCFAVEHMPDRFVFLQQDPLPSLVIYTDASTEHGEWGLRVGILIIDPLLPHARCGVYDIPPLIQAAWMPRQTQIMAAELLAGPLVAATGVAKNRDVLFFCDNQPALACLIKAASSKRDCAFMALACSLFFMHSNSRVWYEYVDTKQNLADCLSRKGWEDPEVIIQLRNGAWIPLDHAPCWEKLLGELPDLLEFCGSALGE
jgi:hypothetical protein